MFGVLDALVVVGYLVGMMVLGGYCAKFITSVDSYVLANRSLGLVVMIGTTLATVIGAASTIAQGGYTYQNGISAVWSMIAWTAGWSIMGFLAKPIHRSKARDLPELFGERWGRPSRLMAQIATIWFSVYNVAAQTAAIGTIFTLLGSPWGLSYTTATLIGGMLTVLYTCAGGLYAVAYSDVVQAVILLLGVCIVLPGLTYPLVGGWQGVVSKLPPTHLNMFVGLSSITIIGWFFSYGFTASCHPAYIQRVLAAKDERVASRGLWAAIWTHMAYAVVICLVALPGIILYPKLAQPETVLPKMILEYLPTGIKGFLVVSLLAVVMSTIDSMSLLAGAGLEALVSDLSGHKLSDAERLKRCRVYTLLAGGAAVLLATYVGGVLKLFSLGTDVYGAMMFFPFLCVFLKWRATPAGTLGAMVIGLAVVVIWNLVLGMPYGIRGVIPGSILAGLFILIMNLAAKKEEPAASIASGD